jgi:hypothetical protein
MAMPDAATERVEASARPAEAKAAADNKTRSQPATERNGTAARFPKRRGKRGNGSKTTQESAEATRFFLLKPGSNGTPELDREVDDENTALVEALKTGATFIMLSEWRAAVDNATKGRPVITREAVLKT